MNTWTSSSSLVCDRLRQPLKSVPLMSVKANYKKGTYRALGLKPPHIEDRQKIDVDNFVFMSFIIIVIAY